MSRLVPRNQSGKQSRLLPRLVPRNQSGKLSRQLPRQLQDAVSQDPGKPPENPKFGCFPRFLGIGGLEGSWDGRGSSRSSIPYSIYISQFQTGTPKPRYIGFRDGGRENGTQNGQFRPVFGHILWPLSDPSLFHEIRDFSRPRARFLTFREKS